MKGKRLANIFVCLILICCLLTGCAPFESQPDSLLLAPKLTGEMQPVQEALEKKLDGKYQLKFPSSGETKSAITLVDLNGDGQSEGVAFYSTSDDSTVTQHIAVIDYAQGVWQVSSQESIVAVGVESVYFTDMDGDGIREIVVGWNVYGTSSKTVAVYEYSGRALITLMAEPFTVITLCDLDGNLSQDLLLLHLDSTTSRAFARYFSVNSQGISELGICEMDGNVTSYNEPVLSALPSGEFCVYIDCIKGAGMITEVIFFKDGKLQCPLYDTQLMENTVTYRPAIVPCRDYDGDSVIEVPVMRELPVGETLSASAAYLTVWNSFDTEGLTPRFYALMNYSDGYSIQLSRQLALSTTTIRSLENRERIICEYDYESGTVKAELFRVRVVSKTAYDSGMYKDGYIHLAESDSLVWICTVRREASEYGVTEDSIKEMFSLIS